MIDYKEKEDTGFQIFLKMIATVATFACIIGVGLLFWVLL